MDARELKVSLYFFLKPSFPLFFLIFLLCSRLIIVEIPLFASLVIKARQSGAVERMLNLNGPALASDQWSETWKLLIFDTAGRDIISPLLNVAQLR